LHDFKPNESSKLFVSFERFYPHRAYYFHHHRWDFSTCNICGILCIDEKRNSTRGPDKSEIAGGRGYGIGYKQEVF